MKIVMYSNYLNHHQLPLARAFNRIPGVEYIFVATTPFDTDRAKMGYNDENGKHDFVLRAYEGSQNEKMARELSRSADIVIVGSANDIYMSERINDGKTTFHSSERYFKKGLNLRTFPRSYLSAMKHIRPYQGKTLYYLCSSAYTAQDVNRFAHFPDRCFKWGYFTETEQKTGNELLRQKGENEKPVLLWVGRFIDLKHPETAIRAAYALKKIGFQFSMNMIGGGEREGNLREMVKKLRLEETVRFLGYLSQEEVRNQMERADIYLMTSDFREGWGATLNEAMSCGCASVASHACGSAPFLIRDGVNGYLYESGNEEDLILKAGMLLSDKAKRMSIGSAAWQDLQEIWSAKTAAERLIKLNEAIPHQKAQSLFAEGPCSPAPIIKNGWYKANEAR